MVITIPVQSHDAYGVRPINLNKDVPQVLRLLELVFGKVLGEEGQRLFNGVNLDGQPGFLWRLNPGINKLAVGYVWEENGNIIGNATVINTKTVGRFLVVNVAVHPDSRRQGIARGLMETVINMVQERQGQEIMLQVEKDNLPAVQLYHSLDFREIGHMKSWRTSVSRLREIPPTLSGQRSYFIRELHRREWQAAYELDLTALHPDLNWPESLAPNKYRGGVWRWIDKYMNGRNSEIWVIADENNQLIGLAGIWGEWGRPYQLCIRVHPSWRGYLERPLLAKVIRRLRRLSRRNIRLDHPDDDLIMNQLLEEANFQPGRTLTHMVLAL